MMKGKAKQTSVKDTGKKVFDVMRPGGSLPQSTSRPVIVGHKPQVKDPMMSEHNEEERGLLNSKQKVSVQPSQQPDDHPAVTPTELKTTPTDDEKPSAPDVPTDLVAPILTAGTTPTPVEPAEGVVKTAPAIEDESISQTSPVLPEIDKPTEPAPPKPETETISGTEPVQTTVRPLDDSTTTIPSDASQQATSPLMSGVVFEDLPASRKPLSQDDAEPLPVLPDEPTPQIIVSHHKQKKSGGKVFLIFLLVVVAAVIVFDILLDSGFVVLDGVPHTDFF